MSLKLASHKIGCVGRFTAMACPCEVIIETKNTKLANAIAHKAHTEVSRIEKKFSRYNPKSVLSHIHANPAKPVEVDAETAMMLDFADQAYHLSNGLFDITSGILRKIWKFDCSDKVPSRKQAKALLPHIGWKKITWDKPQITLPQGVELDFGGFGKEYATDRAIELISQEYDIPIMVNLGGDLRVTQNLRNKAHWDIIIEDAHQSGDIKDRHPNHQFFQLQQGAVVTSGDTKRFLLKDGVRYPHILNPRTGWSVKDAPRSVTLGSKTCLEAGLLATLAMLKGRHAEAFLQEQQVVHLVQW